MSFLGAEMRCLRRATSTAAWCVGSVLFGIGWGVAGFCPGPALVALGMGELKALVFVAAMLAGMGAFEFFERRKRVPAPHAA